MQRPWIDDDCDGLKRTVFSSFDQHFCASLQVLAMRTDADHWTGEDEVRYLEAIGLPASNVIWNESDLRPRQFPFSRPTLPLGDLFIDADTGISSKKEAQYVSFGELVELTDDQPSRLLFVYQHAQRKPDYDIRTIENSAPLQGFSVRGVRASMLVLSRDRERLVEAIRIIEPRVGVVVRFGLGIQRTLSASTISADA